MVDRRPVDRAALRAARHTPLAHADGQPGRHARHAGRYRDASESPVLPATRRHGGGGRRQVSRPAGPRQRPAPRPPPGRPSPGRPRPPAGPTGARPREPPGAARSLARPAASASSAWSWCWRSCVHRGPARVRPGVRGRAATGSLASQELAQTRHGARPSGAPSTTATAQVLAMSVPTDDVVADDFQVAPPASPRPRRWPRCSACPAAHLAAATPASTRATCPGQDGHRRRGAADRRPELRRASPCSTARVRGDPNGDLAAPGARRCPTRRARGRRGSSTSSTRCWPGTAGSETLLESPGRGALPGAGDQAWSATTRHRRRAHPRRAAAVRDRAGAGGEIVATQRDSGIGRGHGRADRARSCPWPTWWPHRQPVATRPATVATDGTGLAAVQGRRCPRPLQPGPHPALRAGVGVQAGDLLGRAARRR